MDSTNKRAYYYIVPHRMMFGLLGWATSVQWPYGSMGHTPGKVKLAVFPNKKEAIQKVAREATFWYNSMHESAEVRIMNKWGRYTKEGFTIGYDPVRSEG